MNAPNGLHAAPALPLSRLFSTFCSRLLDCWKFSAPTSTIRLASTCCGLSTVTVSVADPVLLCASVDEHVTVVAPIGKIDPEACTHVVVVAPSTASSADAVNVATAPPGEIAGTVTLPDVVTTGGVVSATLICAFRATGTPQMTSNSMCDGVMMYPAGTENSTR